MNQKSKRYCSNCGERISHSSNRCLACGALQLTWRRVVIYVLIAIVVVTVIFLWLDYQDIEVFR